MQPIRTNTLLICGFLTFTHRATSSAGVRSSPKLSQVTVLPEFATVLHGFLDSRLSCRLLHAATGYFFLFFNILVLFTLLPWLRNSGYCNKPPPKLSALTQQNTVFLVGIAVQYGAVPVLCIMWSFRSQGPSAWDSSIFSGLRVRPWALCTVKHQGERGIGIWKTMPEGSTQHFCLYSTGQNSLPCADERVTEYAFHACLLSEDMVL